MNYKICKCEAIIEELSKIDYCNQKWLDFIPEHLLHHLLMGHKWCNYGLWSSQYQLYTSKLPLGDNQMCTCRNTRCNYCLLSNQGGLGTSPMYYGIFNRSSLKFDVNPANIILTRFSCLKKLLGGAYMHGLPYTLSWHLCMFMSKFFNLGLFTISYVS